MPAAAAFKYHRPFGFCAEHKTSAQISALACGHYADSLANVMAVWWNLYTVDITVNGETKTSIALRNYYAGGGYAAMEADAVMVPRDRVCAGIASDRFSGLGVGIDGFGGDTIRRCYASLFNVVYNTTTGNHEILFTFGYDIDTVFQASTHQFATYVSNGGTCSFLGQSQTSYKRSTISDVNFSISNPTYYTY